MRWNPATTADEFVRAYSGRAGMSPTEMRSHGRDVRPCNCQEEGCGGWMMVNAIEYDDDVRAWEVGHGPHPGRLAKDEWDRWLEQIEPAP